MYAAPAVAGDTVYVGSCFGFFYALDKNTGEVRWKYDTKQDGSPAQFHGSPLFSGELVITGSDRSDKGYVYAFEQETGEVRWKTAAGGIETDLLQFRGTVIGVASGGKLVSLDLKTGEIKWKFSPKTRPYKRFSSETPALSENMLYFGGPDGHVYALKAASGEVAWKRNLQGRILTPLRSIGPHLFAGVREGKIYRLNRKTGAINAEMETEAFPHHSLVYSDGFLLVLLGESTLVCLDQNLETVRWKYTTDGEWSTFFPLIVDDTVIVGNDKGDLFALHREDGKVVRRYHPGGVLRGLGKDAGVIYVGTLKGLVHALRLNGAAEKCE